MPLSTRTTEQGNTVVTLETPWGKVTEVVVSKDIKLERTEQVEPTLRFSFERDNDGSSGV